MKTTMTWEQEVLDWKQRVTTQDILETQEELRQNARKQAFEKGKKGEAYNISSKNYLTNIELTKRLLKLLKKPESLIERVPDRLGHDRRYAIDSAKLRSLGWKETFSFEQAFASTIRWYQTHEAWWRAIKEKSAGFKDYYKKAYAGRVKA